MTSVLTRLARMDRHEIAWRGRATARVAWDRLRFARRPPPWARRALADALSDTASLDDARTALTGGRDLDAHRALSTHIVRAPQRFALAPSCREPLTAAIRDRFPDAPAQADARAARILGGRYDLLGYRALPFTRSDGIDWHLDPVHGRSAPRVFWSDVAYLDPSCGDHKIIWELNRHQHWLALGRAFWLTGNVRCRRRCLDELAGWLHANPPLTGINWASMLELGFRSISWLWALAFFASPDADDDTPWTVDLLLALDRQLTQIERNLSYYFSPNTHLLGEALALYVCSRSLPLLRRAARREALGRRVLLDEARRQIASDGGHCERSTHYHRYTLDFYLLALIVSRMTGDAAATAFADHVSRLADAARLLADDGGQLPQFGDDDGGMLFPIAGRRPLDVRDSLWAASILLERSDLRVGDAPEEAYWLVPGAGRAVQTPHRASPNTVAPRSRALRATGYYVSRSAHGHHVVIDGGVHGYLNGGHAHADALSLTLTVAGVPLLVDTGTGAYTIDRPLRDRLRSSQLHNTLVVDGRSQSIARGPFSWSTAAQTTVHRWETHAAFDYFEGTHDGYAPVEHRRHVLALPGDLLIVADCVRGRGTHTASAHWHVDTGWHVAVRDRVVTFTRPPEGAPRGERAARCQLAIPRGRLDRFDADEATGLGWRAPRYGAVEPSTTLRVTHGGALPFWIASVFGLRHDNPLVDVEFVPVAANHDPAAAAMAMRIVRANSIDVVVLGARDDARAGARVRLHTDAVDTDARMLFYRERDGRVDDVIALDVSRVHVAAQTAFEFEAPHRARVVRAKPDVTTALEPQPCAG